METVAAGEGMIGGHAACASPKFAWFLRRRADHCASDGQIAQERAMLEDNTIRTVNPTRVRRH